LSSRKKRPLASSVVLTDRALSDLRQIEHYSVTQWGRKTADKYLDGIQAALDRVKASREILRLEPDMAPGLYFYRVRKHFLVCDYTKNIVTVLTVIHASMDIPARLVELQPHLADEIQILHTKLHR
jgi:toxin ParE1/3/4